MSEKVVDKLVQLDTQLKSALELLPMSDDSRKRSQTRSKAKNTKKELKRKFRSELHTIITEKKKTKQVTLDEIFSFGQQKRKKSTCRPIANVNIWKESIIMRHLQLHFNMD